MSNADDLIRRQEAIDTFIKATSDGDKAEWCLDVLEKVPSAQPERKQGRWINRSLNILYPDWERYTCSVCGKHSYSYDFCPNCGADMRGEDEQLENIYVAYVAWRHGTDGFND